MALTIKSIEPLLCEMYPVPHRLFGMEEEESGSNEWTIRRLIANIIVGGSRDIQAVRATEDLFSIYCLEELASPDQFQIKRRIIADMLEEEFDIKYAGKKAEYILNAVRMIYEDFDGVLTGDMKQMESLPGVGHHAASVVSALAFGKDAFGVDLHVRRILKRMGIVEEKAIDRKIEKLALEEANSPGHLSRALVEFGQQYCRFHPSCKKCPLQKQCPQLKEV